ncbi:SDR family NAD(P)-dependent oxidoreductase [Terrabacter aeriphilus]|uniref:SDR family NAD(P)-dependent oxidoreductase n=1 Tax=Terrabacter aeriphilus TaxID=515662 RepID=A0ABP9JAV6_9MICO
MARITTPFGFASTTAEVTRGIDLTGKAVVVTGGASGLGLETVRALAALGADVTMGVRDVEAGNRAAADVAASTGHQNLRVLPLDLADRASIHDFIARWDGPLDILINNAGVMAIPELQRTPDGWELQFATNYLGHFELAQGLHPALAEAGAARIVSVSSSGHLFSPVVFDDLHFDFRPYDPIVAYGQSKSATTLFAVAASRRWGADGITANAVMPGAIATNLQRHTGGLRTPAERRKTPQQGAATTLLLATSPLLEGVGGRYFEDGNEAEVVTHRTPELDGVAAYAIDPDNADRLWERSLALLG